MTTAPPPTDADDPPTQAVTCGYCPRKILWLAAHPDGSRQAFDAIPVARSLDPQGEGWLPGTYVLPGHTKAKVMLAPLAMHPADKRRRAAHVMLPHVCPGQQPAQFWGAA